VRFFFPDSQDLVDPSFDFKSERRSRDRLRQRDDLYAHEVFDTPAFDGLLVSKGIVDGFGEATSRYSLAQRQRLLRLGAREFFRLPESDARLPIVGDCGAFTYVRESVPPYSIDELIEFYESCRFDMGISLDHVVLSYRPQWDEGQGGDSGLLEARRRQALTLEYAEAFLRAHRAGGCRFEPWGVAQGWSPKSYGFAVRELQRLGYRYIALGGMVPLKTNEILESLAAIHEVRGSQTRLHLLGVTRPEQMSRFGEYGVVSFDSTSPLRQAFKDSEDNYYWWNRTFTAVRIPQVEGNPGLQRAIKSGRIRQEEAQRLERASLEAMSRFSERRCSLDEALTVLLEYEALYDPRGDHSKPYREVLEARPWEECGCKVCRSLGHHVILFRGAERNRRRGFHNLWVFYRQMRKQLGLALPEAA
jgi:hypothetical protein